MKSAGRKEKKRPGMALPLTLIVLLVAGAMVAVAFVFIENMMSTTKMKSDDEFRLNAAIAGLERGKTWLYDRIVSDDIPSLVAAGAINAVTASEDYKELLVFSGGAVPNPTLSFSLGEADVKVRIYDLAYDYGETLTFEQGIPPRMYRAREGGSLKAGQSYASSNAAEGNPGSGSPESKILKAYLVRSEAIVNKGEKDEMSKTVEQAIFVQPK
ncbi:MAG: hypothetical protein GXX92_12200 [Clostridiales bacterium]|nr:hypothetical protein [Clostridiales bacterium]